MAPNAYKGTLGSVDAARAIEDGLRRARPDLEVDFCPISDGGDGFLDALALVLGVERRAVVVRGPVHAPVKATYGLRQAPDGQLAIVESAQAVGIALLPPDHLDPLGASSGGLGELLAEARQAGARAMLVGLGGSASTDGGAGMARALGFRFLDSEGHEVAEGGGSLHRLRHIDAAGFDPSWHLVDIRVARDVDNPLLGPTGAAAVFAPQKGARAEEVAQLEEGLARLASVCREELGVDVAGLPGGGAAGGLGAGMVAFLGARLEPGADLVVAAVHMEERLAGASMLITGEGRLDHQSLTGKAPVVVGRLARRRGVWSVCLAGAKGDGWEETVGDAFDDVVELVPQGGSATADPRLASDRLSSAAAALV